MFSHRKWRVLGLCVMAAVFLFGVVRLFHLRFDAGDIYPPYSSLRSDPLGVKVLYESLDRLPGVTVQRRFDLYSPAETKWRTTLLYLGVSAEDPRNFNADVIDMMRGILDKDGRVVIAFLPGKQDRARKPAPRTGDAPATGSEEQAESHRDTSKKTSTRDTAIEESDDTADKGLAALGARLVRSDGGLSGEMARYVPGSAPQARLGDISWHSDRYFKLLDSDWLIVYTRDDQPVIAEKKLERGSIVLCADGYLFSNEALGKERRAELLAWYVGSGDPVVFEESHLGVQKGVGVADLIHRYRLYGFVMAIFIFMALFVWQRASSFIPPIPLSGYAGPPGASRDHKEGMVSLLRRNVPTGQILPLCVREWEKAFGSKHAATETSGEIHQQIRAVMADAPASGKKDDILKRYHAIRKIIAKRKGVWEKL